MQIDLRKQNIPWLMAAARATLGPIVILGQACQWSGITLAALIVAALLSDIFDGILARRWHCDTPAVRLFDSMADTLFYLCVAVALWLRAPNLCHQQLPLFGVLMAFESALFLFAIAKFGKPASYHSYLAKSWGLLLAIAVVSEFATAHAAPLISAALILGIFCNIEGLAMSCILPDWVNDVKTLAIAWRLRTQMLAHLYPRTSSDVVVLPTPIRKPQRLVPLAILIATLAVAAPASAQIAGHATYINGTVAHIAPASIGVLDTSSSPDQLVFKTDSGTVPITYEKIQSVGYKSEVTHHLGVLPAIGVALVRHRDYKHLFSITYTDDAGSTQTILLEVSKEQTEFLIPLMRTRVPTCIANNSFKCTLGFKP